MDFLRTTGVYISAPAERADDQRALRSKVYYLDSAGSLHEIADGFRFSNGLVVRADARALLVNDTDTRRIYEFQITSPGTVTGRRVFAELADTKAWPRLTHGALTVDGPPPSPGAHLHLQNGDRVNPEQGPD